MYDPNDFKVRMLALIEYAVHIEVLDTDHTSVLFIATFEDGGRRKGIFYPKEWQLVEAFHDDFEMESDLYQSQVVT